MKTGTYSLLRGLTGCAFLMMTVAVCHKDSGDGFPLAILPALSPQRDLQIFLGTGTTGFGSGSAGMDAKCMSDTLKPGDGSTYKAFVVDSARRACVTANCSGGGSENLNWVLQPGRTYYRANGFVRTTIGVTNAAAIFEFPLQNGLHSGTTSAWTGLSTDWTINANNCANWTSNAGGVNGTQGSGTSLTNTALNNVTTACSSANIIFCVQQ